MADKTGITRRGFVAGFGAALGATALSGCAKGSAKASLPPAEPDPESPFGVDLHVNMDTIDSFIESGALAGAVCFDMRLVDDPAHYEAIGGNSKLTMALEGFTVLPYPWMGTLQELPVEGAYAGPCLYSVEWAAEGSIVSAAPNFRQAPDVLADLFPKDAPIVLMCGGGGYAGMMRALLIHLGWDASKVYNIGGMWGYTGDHAVQLVSYADLAAPEYFLWRATMPIIDFGTLR